MSRRKVKTSIAIWEEQQSRIMNDQLFTNGKKTLSKGIERGFDLLDRIKSGLIDNLKGKFNYNEVLLLHKIVENNKRTIITEVFKYNPSITIDNLGSEKFNIPFYLIINKEILKLRNSGVRINLNTHLDIAKKIMELKEYELLVLVNFLINTDESVQYDLGYLFSRLLSDEEFSLHLDKIETIENPRELIPEITIEDVKFAMSEEDRYDFENGKKIIIKTKDDEFEIYDKVEFEEE